VPSLAQNKLPDTQAGAKDDGAKVRNGATISSTRPPLVLEAHKEAEDGAGHRHAETEADANDGTFVVTTTVVEALEGEVIPPSSLLLPRQRGVG
jgi:hypothetical protein